MDFFGFGASTDLSTPVGILVKSATDSFLVSPDWAKNLDICDAVASTSDGADHASKAIMRRMADSDPKVVSLALVVAETCMKNCGQRFAGAINQYFMDELVNVARGRSGAHNAEEALRIIQQWGRAFEQKRSTFPIFFETFMGLKAKNVRFPPEEEGITPGFEPKKSTTVPALVQQAATRSEVAPKSKDSTKLERDLMTVFEKVRLCQEMLLVSPGIAQDEALSEVIGFLEACRDRMIDIIEAGSQGLLGEELFEIVLRVNDSILRTLEAEKTGQKIPVEEFAGAAAAPSSSSSSAAVPAPTVQSNDLLDVFGGPPVAAPTMVKKPAASAMAMDDDDEFGALTMKRAGNGSSKPAPAPIKKLAPPPSATSGKPALTEAVAADPFGDSLLNLAPVSAPAPVAAPAPVWNNIPAPLPRQDNAPLFPASLAPASNNPFDAPTPAVVPADPFAATAFPPPAAPQQASIAKDIDLLFANAPAPAPAATASAGTIKSEQMTDADFDAFLSGLKS